MWLVAWLVMWAFWMLLVDTVAWAEICAGAVAGGVGATVVLLLHRVDVIRFRPRLRWIRRLGTIGVAIVKDIFVVSAVLVRRLTGRPVGGGLRVVPMVPPLPLDRHDLARRAALIAGISISPNTFVVGIAPDGASVLVHQLDTRNAVVVPR